MKTYYAVGDTSFSVQIIVHNSALSRCHFFSACPPVHAGDISEADKKINFYTCDNFILFENKETAVNFATEEKFNKRLYGPNVFLVFKVSVDENKLAESILNYNKTNYIETSRDNLTLEESYVNLDDIFGNTTPEFLRVSCQII